MDRVKLNLLEIDGNAFALLGAFQSAARRQGWPAQRITEVTTEARNGDYDHLLATLAKYTEETGESETDDA